MSKGKSIISFVLVIFISAGLILAAIYGVSFGDRVIIPSVSDRENGIRLGLDLVGGSSITYEAQIEPGTNAQAIADGMRSSIAIMQNRLTAMGYTEATVSRAGENRIVVEIPAEADPETAVQQLGVTAQLSFVDSDGNVVLSGSDIKKAESVFGYASSDKKQEYYIALVLEDAAVAKWAEATKNMSSEAHKANGTNYIKIMLDENEVSKPSVNGEINSNECQITGSFDAESSKYLAGLISGGRLPFALKDIQHSSIGATLGEESLNSSLLAGLIGLALVMIFMMIIYRLPGVLSCLALLCYVGIIANILTIFKINLSLPGIAGIILSIGMAVDANVVIFERIKEELRIGKTLSSSIKSGFNRAFTAILDSNVTTLIAAVVLWIFGTGPIVGFAITLFIGVAVSMFTAVVISKALLNSMVGLNIKNIKAYGA